MLQIADLTLDEHDVADWAARLAPVFKAGDTVLLQGGIGAGKTHFARHLILALLPAPEDVPSPTFTLVQVYDGAAFEIWHTDLYRLTGEDQIDELGLIDAMASALCLIEWPDRLGALTPDTALRVSFAPTEDGAARRILVSSDDARWVPRLAEVAK